MTPYRQPYTVRRFASDAFFFLFLLMIVLLTFCKFGIGQQLSTVKRNGVQMYTPDLPFESIQLYSIKLMNNIPTGNCLGVDSHGMVIGTTCGAGVTVALQTNGVVNSLQTKMNLQAGPNVSLTADAAGNVVIASVGTVGPTGPPVTFRGSWNASAAYATGDSVSYTGSSYVRLVAGTTSGNPAGDTTSWGLLAASATPVFVDNMAFSDNSQLFSINGFINTSGVLVPDANWLATDYLDVAQIKPQSYGLYNSASGYNLVSYYDANHAYIGGVGASSSPVIYTAMPAYPTGTAFTRYTRHVVGSGGGITDPEPQAANQSFSYTLQQKSLVAALGAVSGLEDGTVPAGVASNVVYALPLTTLATLNGFINSSGAFSSDGNWRSTNSIAMSPGKKVTYSLFGVSAMNVVSFYNSSNALLAAVPGGGGSGAVVSGIAVAPSSTSSMRISFGSPDWSTAAGTTASAYMALPLDSVLATVQGSNAQAIAGVSNSVALAAPFDDGRKMQCLSSADKIMLYGDSRSSLDYDFYRAAWASLTGCTVNNGGFSGTTVAYQAQNAQLQTIYTYAPKLIVVLPGGNDTGASGSVGTFSGVVAGEPVVSEPDITQDFDSSANPYFIQAISQQMRKIKAHYYNIRTRAGLTGSESEATKNSMIAAVLNPMLLYYTDIPQQRNNSSDPYSSPANWQRKRTAIIECCNKYRVRCVDSMTKFAVDMSQEPFWTSPTNKTTNNGVFYMDGLHQNQFGSGWLAQMGVAATF